MDEELEFAGNHLMGIRYDMGGVEHSALLTFREFGWFPFTLSWSFSYGI